jgi:hypothetical protein
MQSGLAGRPTLSFSLAVLSLDMPVFGRRRTPLAEVQGMISIPRDSDILGAGVILVLILVMAAVRVFHL